MSLLTAPTKLVTRAFYINESIRKHAFILQRANSVDSDTYEMHYCKEMGVQWRLKYELPYIFIGYSDEEINKFVELFSLAEKTMGLDISKPTIIKTAKNWTIVTYENSWYCQNLFTYEIGAILLSELATQFGFTDIDTFVENSRFNDPHKGLFRYDYYRGGKERITDVLKNPLKFIGKIPQETIDLWTGYNLQSYRNGIFSAIISKDFKGIFPL